MKVRSIRKTFVFGVMHFGNKKHRYPGTKFPWRCRPIGAGSFSVAAVDIGKGRIVK